MTRLTMLTIVTLVLVPAAAPKAMAAVTDNLVAYYDFQESTAAGLTNKAPGASGGDLTWGGSPSQSSTGFAGDATFTAVDGDSDRGTLLVGNALNLVDAENAFVVSPYGTAELGNTFTISLWTYLAPGASNGSPQFHALESGDTGVFDVSWGTPGNYSTTGRNDRIGYVETTSTGTSFNNAFAEEVWDHILIVYDNSGANPTASFYVNGATTPVTVTDTSGTFAFTKLHFGDSRDGTGDRDWDGMLDEVALWDRELTALERTEIYNLGLNGQALTAIPAPAALPFGLGLLGLLTARRRS